MKPIVRLHNCLYQILLLSACDSCAIEVTECPAYEATKQTMPMEQNSSYGELGHIIYETIS